MENQNERGIIEGLSIRTAILAELKPKFNNGGYTEGLGVKCSIDKMDNNKWCVYHYVNRGHKAGQSYKGYENMEDFYADFDVEQVFRARKTAVQNEN